MVCSMAGSCSTAVSDGEGQGGAARPDTPEQLQAFEDGKVNGAIKTDFILSAEIMAITLASMPESSFWTQAVVLAVVGLGITVVVYGAVALIVKADDAGLSLAQNGSPVSSLLGLRDTAGSEPGGADRAISPVTRGLGRGLVIGMPYFLKALAMVGTAAMLWVGGGIIVHGLEEFGLGTIPHLLHDAAEAAGHAVPFAGGVVAWIVQAAGSAVVGIVIGGVIAFVMHKLKHR